MPHKPAISVLMPIYNTPEKYLRKAIESILNQTFTDYEFILLLNAPTDGSDAVVKSYHDERMIIHENHKTVSIGANENIGLSMARGKYIATMHADDVALPERLSTQYAYMENHAGIDVLGAAVFEMDVNNHCFDVWTAGAELGDLAEERKVRMLFGNAGICDPTTFFRASFLHKCHLAYDDESQEISVAQDYSMWIDVVLSGGRIYTLPECLLCYRRHPSQTSTTKVHLSEKEKYILFRRQAERLLGTLSDADVLAHDAIGAYQHLVSGAVSVRSCDEYMARLLEANERLGLYDRKVFRKVLLSLRLEGAYNALRADRSAIPLKTKYFFPMLAPSVFFYTFGIKSRRRKITKGNMRQLARLEPMLS